MELQEQKRVSLAYLPTPIIELTRLSQFLGGPRLFIKRDDLTGLALGGNKTRKLEYILAEALAQGADCLITAGAIQSNHCRQTAAAAATLGLECHLVLGGEAPELANGNVILDTLLGAHLHWSGDNRKGEDIPALVATLQAQGKQPYVVPYGGSNVLGATAYVAAMEEVMRQTHSGFTHMVIASSSGATQAGMMVGQRHYAPQCDIIGVAIDKEGIGDTRFEDTVLALANDTAHYLKLPIHFDAKDVLLETGYTGAGYAVIGDAEREAIALTAQLSGILLDPVYTGRAMAGLFGMIRAGKFRATDRVLFWHTGGAPALFAYADALQPAQMTQSVMNQYPD